jgi:hypothetical protein
MGQQLHIMWQLSARLSLVHGQKFQVIFAILLIFSRHTNSNARTVRLNVVPFEKKFPLFYGIE